MYSGILGFFMIKIKIVTSFGFLRLNFYVKVFRKTTTLKEEKRRKERLKGRKEGKRKEERKEERERERKKEIMYNFQITRVIWKIINEKLFNNWNYLIIRKIGMRKNGVKK